MFDASFPVMAAWASAGVFGLAGLINTTAVRPLRTLYDAWDVPAYFYRPLGIVELVTAAFLATPDFRMWGIILAGSIMFGSIVLLLDQRHYVYAAAGMVVMLALLPATLAVPPVRSYAPYVSDVRPPARTLTAQRPDQPALPILRVSETTER